MLMKTHDPKKSIWDNEKEEKSTPPLCRSATLAGRHPFLLHKNRRSQPIPGTKHSIEKITEN
jgi:hypothetical protein